MSSSNQNESSLRIEEDYLTSEEVKDSIQNEQEEWKKILPIAEQEPAYDKVQVTNRLRTICGLGVKVTSFLKEKMSVRDAEVLKEIRNQIFRFETALDTFYEQEGTEKDQDCTRVERLIIDLFRDFFVRYHHRIISNNNVNGYLDDKWLLGKVNTQEIKPSNHIRLYLGSNQGKKTSIYLPLSEIYGICHLIDRRYPDQFELEGNHYQTKQVFLNYFYLLFYHYEWDRKTKYKIRKVIEHIRERLGYKKSFDVNQIPILFDKYTGPLKEMIYNQFSDKITPEGREKIDGFIEKLQTSFKKPKTTNTIGMAFEKIKETAEGTQGDLMGGIGAIMNGLKEVTNDEDISKNFKEVFSDTTGVSFDQVKDDLGKKSQEFLQKRSKEEGEEKEGE